MKRFACRYAIIRFLPYAETQEFANVGIVMTCPETGYFGYKLEKRRYGRVAAFFAKLDIKVFRAAMHGFEQELARIADLVSHERLHSNDLRVAFDALVHPREAIVRFSAVRPTLVESSEEALDQLFAYYVEHDFATPDYQERVVMKRVRALVNSLRLERPFKPRDIGDPDYVHVKFPLVQADDGQVLKAIKPFFLAQDEPNKILTYGGGWVDRVKRLRNHKLLPEAVLFAVEGPSANDGSRLEACEEICADLRSYDVEVVTAGQEQRISAFASA